VLWRSGPRLSSTGTQFAKVFSALGVALSLTDARKDANKLGGRAFLWTVTNIRYYK